MFHASGSSLPAIEAFIGLTILASLRTQVYAELIVCDIPKNLTLESKYYGSRIQISQAELHVHLDENSITGVGEDQDSARDPQSTLHYLKIQTGSITVHFRGYVKEAMTYENYLRKQQSRFASEAVKISEHYDASLSGVVAYDRQMLNFTNPPEGPFFEGCRIALTLTRRNRPTNEEAIKMGSAAVHPDEIASEVRRLAESCVQHEMCPKSHWTQSMTGKKFPPSRSKRGWWRSIGQTLIYRPLFRTFVNLVYFNKEKKWELPLFAKTVDRKLPWIGRLFVRVQMENGYALISVSVVNHYEDAYEERGGMKLGFHIGFKINKLQLAYDPVKLTDVEEDMSGRMSVTWEGLHLRIDFYPDWTAWTVAVYLHNLYVESYGTVTVEAPNLQRAFPEKTLTELTSFLQELIHTKIDKALSEKTKAAVQKALVKGLTGWRPVIDICYGD